ncbi:hypothetical protein [Saccharothrix obliqua]|uniref:hypothetical protein n=1 Tax=Saccharothrix obliqua TaxID=2861747 RepID=UPI001C5CC3A6|nr:hypothetical protein [Saccharothrix obliqua]MBW4717071.1 hypothetical protein [Saccharothrix obliqua]
MGAGLHVKLARRFDLFDANDDGVVRRRDFTGTAERLVRRFRVPPAPAERVRTAYEMVWLFVVASGGADRQVERAAFAAGGAELARRLGAADVVAFRECASGGAGHVVEFVVALGAHPGDAPLIRAALEPHGPWLPPEAVGRLVTAFFADDAPSGLYGR